MVYVVLIGIGVVVCFVLIGVIPFRFARHVKSGKRIVACVGDSNTFGEFLFPRHKKNYPYLLQKLMPEYQIFNLGVNGSTGKIFSVNTYIKTSSFDESIHLEPDVVIIILGSNDSKKINWTNKDDFKKEYKELILQYRKLGNKPEIYIGTPMYPHGKSYGIDYVNFDDINKSIFEIGVECGIPVIDFYNKTKKYIEYFGFDKVHLNRKGHLFVAQTICDFIDRY